MRRGHLSEFFIGVAAKRLSAVEAHPQRSNQHEFNGVGVLKALLGTEKQTLAAQFIYLGDDEENYVQADGFVTWYDAREQHPTRSEHRLYFPTTSVSDSAAEGDLAVFALRQDGSVAVVLARARSTHEQQLLWLFNLRPDIDLFQLSETVDEADRELSLAVRHVLRELGIDATPSDDLFLDLLMARYGSGLPSTKEFSEFARSTCSEISVQDDPDQALLAWLDREEILFRTLERHIVEDRLKIGFEDDVDGFIAYSLSVQNRRKSRAGHALENHLEATFSELGVRYARNGETENRARPDFLFPGVTEYHDQDFPTDLLSMLGSKSTCKDRWRQVLSEAARIPVKHLLTLEPGISENQTTEMRSHNLRLVLPTAVHATYTPSQREWLMSLSDFIAQVRAAQVKRLF